jgi:hypothetical protein
LILWVANGTCRRAPDYLRGFLVREMKKWAEAIKANGIEPEGP